MSKVAVLRTTPQTVVEDYGRLMDLAGYREAVPFDAQTCLRINISWHVYMPACSTTPAAHLGWSRRPSLPSGWRLKLRRSPGPRNASRPWPRRRDR